MPKTTTKPDHRYLKRKQKNILIINLKLTKKNLLYGKRFAKEYK